MKNQNKISPKLKFEFDIPDEDEVVNFSEEFEISKEIKKQKSEKDIKIINKKDKTHGRRNDRNSKLF